MSLHEAVQAFQLAEIGFGERMQARGVLFDPALGVEAGLLAALPHLLPSERGGVDGAGDPVGLLTIELDRWDVKGIRMEVESLKVPSGTYKLYLHPPAQAAQVESPSLCVDPECRYRFIAHSHRAEPVAQGEASGLYYLQDTRQYVGNCPMWWAINGKGYVTRVDRAHRYTLDQAMKQHRSRSTDVPWACAVIDALRRPTVDMQEMGSVEKQLAMLAAATPSPGEPKTCTRNCDCVGPCKMGAE